MPVTPTYPGVYVEEIPSGVRTITGVSTSVAAFVGAAKRGPINKAVHILSYSDFERSFGGLDARSELSYAVRQFFLNGGSEAWVVRLAKDAIAAKRTLQNSAASPINVLDVTALDEGAAGNDIEVRVDYQTDNPASTFNLTLNYVSKDNPANQASEVFRNLSLNSQDSRYVCSAVNGVSKLVSINRVASLDGLGQGSSISGNLSAVNPLIDSTHNQFRVSVDGASPITVTLTAANLAAVRNEIADQIGGGATCTVENENQIKITSATTGETSSIRVLPGFRNDVAARLQLGTLYGGQEQDAVAAIRPAEIPFSGVLISNEVSGFNPTSIPDTVKGLQISLDGYNPNLIKLNAPTGNNKATRLVNVAAQIETSVQALKPSNPAYRYFKCIFDETNNKLQLISGTRGAGSSVVVTPVEGDNLATQLCLLQDADKSKAEAINITLQGGNESPYSDSEAYSLFISERSTRRGIYALETVDLFNLLVLPGVSDPGILMDADAYCKERRTFLIADASQRVQTPSDMANAVSGTELPKTDYGAVYYPWVYIADPLNNGKLRLTAPSGAIAGLYARTDSTRGVWKAPAGTEASLVGVQALAHKLTDAENGSLNPLGVNCIRVLPAYGAVSWGARTLKGADQVGSEYKYIPVRRLALFIEESLYRGTQWVVFEPNDEPLWSQIRLNLGAFMHGLFRQGAFQGKSPREAYFVKCDSETTTQNDIDLGIVNIKVGFAPLKPAEFVIIQLQQMAGQIQA